jgi:membrane-associated phospholipid phosphatase
MSFVKEKKLLLILFSAFLNTASLSAADTDGYVSLIKNSFPSVSPFASQDTVRRFTGFYDPDSIFSLRSEKGFLPSLFTDLREQFTAPLRFDSKDWIKVGEAAGITVTLFVLDGNIDKWARTQKQQHPWVRKTSPVITELGNRYGFYIVGGMGALSMMMDKQKGLETSLLATQAMITTGAWTRLIKTFTGRERPKGAYIYSHDSAGEWYGPFSQIKWVAGKKPIYEFDSFPSGHTSQAFAIATVFASRYNDQPVIPVLCYSAASLVGVTRLIEHEHWASDVFVGALLGYFSGKQVINHFEKTHKGLKEGTSSLHSHKPEFNIIESGNQLGFALTWH